MGRRRRTSAAVLVPGFGCVRAPVRPHLDVVLLQLQQHPVRHAQGRGVPGRQPEAARAVEHRVRDRDALKQLARDPKIDLGAKIPHGNGQTYLREVLLVADHTAYHVGQIVLVRQLLGIWPAA